MKIKTDRILLSPLATIFIFPLFVLVAGMKC